MPRILMALALGTVLFARPVFAQQSPPATAPTTSPLLTPEETAADARMKQMIFILDATATPEERLRAMKLVERVVQGEIAAITANLPPQRHHRPTHPLPRHPRRRPGPHQKPSNPPSPSKASLPARRTQESRPLPP